MRLFEGTQFDIPPRCDRCQQLVEECRCEPLPKPLRPPDEQTAEIISEQRKRGKSVTLVHGLAAADNDLAALVTTLKNHCGAGGTVKGEVIEIQGEHTAKVAAKLRELGYCVKY